MLFMVEMTVRIPQSLDPEVADAIKAKEKAYSQQLQRDGVQIGLERNYAEAVQRLHAEIDALCKLATEKKRQLGNEFEAWGSVLPRMA